MENINKDRWYTEYMGNKKNTVHYADILGSGEFFGHKNDGDPVFVRLEKIVLEQAKASIIYGEPVGFAKLLALAYKGEADEAVHQIEKATRREDDEDRISINVCSHSFKSTLYGGIDFREINSSGVEKKSDTGECTCPLKYIDSCLFGARMAEVNQDIKNAKILYDRAEKVISNKIKYSSYNEAYIERENTLKNARERMRKITKKSFLGKMVNLFG